MNEVLEHRPLAKQAIAASGCYLFDAFNPPAVTADSDATLAMTDLSQVPSATIHAEATLDEANHSMLVRGVRLLIVVADHQRIAGVVTTTDILGEKPMLVAQQRQSRRGELRVADVMVPVDKVEALALDEVKKATVGDIVATLKADGRAHAIVVGRGQDGTQYLLGIFSASQIARQLGVQMIQTHEVARTFAEIEAVIAGA